MGESRLDDRERADPHRADAEPHSECREEEDERADAPRPRHAAGSDASPRACRGRFGDHAQPRRAAAATIRAKSTRRGPQREAMLSSTATTRFFFTAATPDPPG